MAYYHSGLSAHMMMDSPMTLHLPGAAGIHGDMPSVRSFSTVISEVETFRYDGVQTAVHHPRVLMSCGCYAVPIVLEHSRITVHVTTFGPLSRNPPQVHHPLPQTAFHLHHVPSR